MKFFDHPAVLAFTTEAEIDFTPLDFSAPLGKVQREYLKAQTGQDLEQVFWRRQVHEDTVVLAQGKSSDCRLCPDADAFITNQPGLAIAIRTADCVPVFLFDPVKKAIGLAHAGWKGTHKKIAAKTAQVMRDQFGCQCYDMKIALGPAIRQCCYQVSGEFKRHFGEHVAKKPDGHYLDMLSANRRQLTDLGIPEANISDSNTCTCCDEKYFSFRRSGEKAGRMISLMMLL